MSGQPPGVQTTAPALRWTVHPAAEQPGRAVLLAAIVAVTALLAARMGGSPLFGLFAVLLLGTSLRAWFLPRTYELTADGAREGGPLCRPRELPWSELRRVSPVRFGVHLSTRHATSRLLPDRGLFLRTAGNRDEVLAYVGRMAP